VCSSDLEEVKQIGSRSSFIETWLTEMPMGLGKFDTYDTIEYSIKDFLKNGVTPKSSNGIFKIATDDKLFYWIGAPNRIDIATELYVKPEGLVVSMTGKNPKLKGRAPFASDLYSAILKDSAKNIKLMSDDQLSDEGFALWKNMVKSGHKVSVFDIEEPGKSFQSFEKPEELDKFFKNDDSDFRRYRYVLSEDVVSYVSMRSSFNLRRHRESVPGMALSDYKAKNEG
jgi:hypothetical protein